MNDMSQVKSNELDWNEKMTEATREVFMNAGRKLLAQLATLQSQLTQAHKERDEAVAACAVMWEALNAIAAMQPRHDGVGGIFYPQFDGEGNEIGVQNLDPLSVLQSIFSVANDVSTDCGKAFLERMKEAEWLIKHCITNDSINGKRRDAWLKGGVE